jgi:hypothetical protein
LRRAIVGSLAFFTVACLIWAASDPWKSKPYQQWDDKDVRRILNDSPWSKVVHVNAPWASSGEASSHADDGGAAKSGTGGVVTATPGGGGGAMGGGGAAPGGGGGYDTGMQIPQATFVVRWVSARTVREAILRNAVLSGQMKPEDAEKQLEQPLDAYLLLIAGPDMKPFLASDEISLKDKSFLLAKKTKEKISPTSITIQRGPDGKAIQAIVFTFPMKSANGEATIATDEKSVEFSCSVGAATIQASFEVSKMEDSKGRDL